MCNRYSVTNPSGLAKRFKLDPRQLDELKFKPKYNLAPTEEGLLVIQPEEQREVRKMIFGLIPSWSKDPKMGTHCLNARAETVAEKPAYREPFKRKRCLVLADGFYEWTSAGKAKLPHRVVLKNREPFAFAGLWDTWVSPEGREAHSFAIITTESNDLMRPLNDRMPVILREDEESLWLAPYVNEEKTLRPLLKAFPADEMESFRVDPYVNRAGHEGEKCIQPIQDEPTLF